MLRCRRCKRPLSRPSHCLLRPLRQARPRNAPLRVRCNRAPHRRRRTPDRQVNAGSCLWVQQAVLPRADLNNVKALGSVSDRVLAAATVRAMKVLYVRETQETPAQRDSNGDATLPPAPVAPDGAAQAQPSPPGRPVGPEGAGALSGSSDDHPAREALSVDHLCADFEAKPEKPIKFGRSGKETNDVGLAEDVVLGGLAHAGVTVLPHRFFRSAIALGGSSAVRHLARLTPCLRDPAGASCHGSFSAT